MINCICLLLALFLSHLWTGRENEFAFLILLLVLFSLSFVIRFDVREWLVHCFQHWADWSNWESVVLHCWFLATRRSLKVREGYFALLIPSKWEFSKEYVQTIKRLLQYHLLFCFGQMKYLCHLNSLHLANIYSLYGVSCFFITYAEDWHTLIKQDKTRNKVQ